MTALRFRFTVLCFSIALCHPSFAFAQCQGKTGFDKARCEATTPQKPGGSTLDAFKGKPLATTLGDAIKGETLPPTPLTVLTPLNSLPRNEQGAYLLTPGEYEGIFESFPLDGGASQSAISFGGFTAAEIKGTRDKAIRDTLKYAELHPEVTHASIAAFLAYVIAGKNVSNMPPAVKQVAAILPKETQKTITPSFLGGLIKEQVDQIAGGIVTDPDVEKKQKEAAEFNKKHKIPGTTGTTTITETLPIARGTWLQFPGGFWVRYYPDPARTRIQVRVPPEVTGASFDPTQYLAVYVGDPPERIGITLRPTR